MRSATPGLQVYGSVTPQTLPAAVGGSAESAAIGLTPEARPRRAGGGWAWGAER